MKKLLKGALTFRQDVFASYEDLFQRLAHGQNPEALFICCADSRVVPNLITNTGPGDLFVLRNIGNILPPYDPTDRDNTEASAIEFALSHLHLHDIVVCGHSHCGAVETSLHGEIATPHIRSWLRHIEPAKKLLAGYTAKTTFRTKALLLSKLNVLTQLENLKTYPGVQERLDAGWLHLHAWFFEIDTARLLVYDPKKQSFVTLSEEAAKHFSPSGNVVHKSLPLTKVT